MGHDFKRSSVACVWFRSVSSSDKDFSTIKYSLFRSVIIEITQKHRREKDEEKT